MKYLFLFTLLFFCKSSKAFAQDEDSLQDFVDAYSHIGINVDSIKNLYQSQLLYFPNYTLLQKHRDVVVGNKVKSEHAWEYCYGSKELRCNIVLNIDSAECSGIRVLNDDFSPSSDKKGIFLVLSKYWAKGYLYKNEIFIPMSFFNKEYMYQIELNKADYLNKREEVRKEWRDKERAILSGIPNDYETRLNVYNTAKRVYGEDIAQLMRKGEVRFGWTKDMCTMARCTDMFKEGRVSTDIGWLDYYYYEKIHKVYYFQNEILVGIYDFSGYVKWVEDLQSALKGFKVILK